MLTLASGTIAGPEARGRVRVIAAADGTRTLETADLWVAPGAPDVRIYVTRNTDGAVDESSIELGPVADGQANQSWDFPSDLSSTSAVSVVVYCHVYSVYFGHATLLWADE
jgi:hypothetical protein